MQFWWVNHKQTFREEIAGGYIWSPKKKANGGFNQTYENLRMVQPGDIVFSYADALIKAIGIASGPCRTQPKPEAFGTAGSNWSDDGWLVPIEWELLSSPISPKHHIAQVAPLLRKKHSPIRTTGDGNQGCYLASIENSLGQLVWGIAGKCDSDTLAVAAAQIDEAMADTIEVQIEQSHVASTDKEQLVKARRGQGIYRLNLEKIEKFCRLTGVSEKRLLIASHIKPWKDSTNQERLDGNNGLLLSPHVDRLFDRGWISFRGDGTVLVSNPAVISVMQAWKIDPSQNGGRFNARQQEYLQYHRDVILGKAEFS